MLNDVFKALSDPTRRKILDLLKEKDLTAGEISNHFNMSKPSISQHLKLLKNAQLVHDEKKGQYIFYSLNTTVFHDIVSWAFRFYEKK
ncbi:DNA-binding transcriptional ArsR family regulator [Pullulanibacillus pueri]|uniref:Transcriptional regulator n=1 Tax=Pullulanibacillus pueri TaxID=1437324 RepID=A0A8J2ZUS4_9BACL|nr:autorepressor SdpR family transcription factor [Pullulanibacillus pueri]MBM7681378.1 DNA-binding transcriptional ArsR family regulator [Pullulanibacillus pueri]GGH78642.1 transcriptional regulator [Pullulanibacillus pueri]